MEQAVKRLIATLFCFGTLLAGSVHAESKSLLLGINEGLAEQAGFLEMQDKYKGLADYLGQVLKEPVRIESSQNLKSSASNLEKARYDLMFCRPSNVAASAMRDEKYSLVAMAKGQFTAVFIVNGQSPLKKPEDIHGKRIAMPAQTALMTKVGLAMMRDMKLDPARENIKYERYMDALAFMVDKKFSDVAVVAPIVAKDWQKKGGRVLFQSRVLPFWSIIASPNMSTEQIAKLRAALMNMENTDEGKKVLARIGVKGFVEGKQQAYFDMMKWIGE
jgi:phosphonate transport system substrate-binding protein